MKSFRYKREKMHSNQYTNRLNNILQHMENGENDKIKIELDKLASELDRIINTFENKDKDLIEVDNTIISNTFPKAGEIFAEGERVRLIAIYDKEKYISTVRHYSQRKHLYDNESFVEAMWQDVCKEECLAYGIYLHNGEYIGYCFVDDVRHSTYSMAIELEPEYCNKGYGTEAMRLLMENVSKLTGKKSFLAKVELDNYASQNMMKKLGGRPDGVCEYLLTNKEIEQFKEENKNCITDKIREVAKEFSMEAEDMLGYVLVYRFNL